MRLRRFACSADTERLNSGCSSQEAGRPRHHVGHRPGAADHAVHDAGI